MENKEKPALERWHGAHFYSNRVHIFFLFFLFFSALLLLWSYFQLNDLSVKIVKKEASMTPIPSQTETACPMLAKLCPNGTNYVGMHGPKCEFDACPGEHCGGNIADALTCSTGYHCQLNLQLPDAGGTCTKDIAAPTQISSSDCKTDSDCPAGKKCVEAGPIIVGPSPIKNYVCAGPNDMIPDAK